MGTLIKLLSLAHCAQFMIGPTVDAVGSDLWAPGNLYCYTEPGCRQGNAGSDWEQGKCKFGKHQTPINIITASVHHKNEKLKIATTPDYELTKFHLANLGTTIQIWPIDFKTGTGTNPLFKYNEKLYKLAQIHFHWGSEDKQGSEHAVDGRFHSMEMHAVHYDAAYTSLAEAAGSDLPGALAVLGFFIQSDPSVTTASILAPIANNLKAVTQYKNGEKKQIEETWKLNKFLSNGKEAFVYEGSLTTPGCNEVVSWIVFKAPIHAKPSEVAAFKKVQNHDGIDTTMNFRVLQHLNSRNVSLINVAA